MRRDHSSRTYTLVYRADSLVHRQCLNACWPSRHSAARIHWSQQMGKTMDPDPLMRPSAQPQPPLTVMSQARIGRRLRGIRAID